MTIKTLRSAIVSSLINMKNALAPSSKSATKKIDSTPIRALLNHLCNGDDQLALWVARWIAYPLRNPGAKMQTAIIVCGEQATGKSLFFQYIVKLFHHHHGRYLGHFNLAANFNDWALDARFILVEGGPRQQDPFVIKNYLASPSIQINRKGRHPIEIKNEMNFVFLSSELQPLSLSKNDRRCMVIEALPAAPSSFYFAVAESIADGGAEEFLHWLLHDLDMADFNIHTPPYGSEISKKKITA